MTKQGSQLVIVEQVTPEIDAGQFYIKKLLAKSWALKRAYFPMGMTMLENIYDCNKLLTGGIG
jgi:hypothetical protein